MPVKKKHDKQKKGAKEEKMRAKGEPKQNRASKDRRFESVLGASWRRLGASWGRLKSVLRASWSVLGRLGDVLGASWKCLGASCGTVLNTEKGSKSNRHFLAEKCRFEKRQIFTKTYKNLRYFNDFGWLSIREVWERGRRQRGAF